MSEFESSLLHQVIQLRRPWLDDLMVLASALGAGGFIWWVTAGITIVFPNRRAAAFRMILAGLVTWVICEYALKPAFDRPRPFTVEPAIVAIDAKPITPSFPSGHAAASFAYALGASRTLPGTAWAWWPLATVIAVSRIYLGVHWPTDVVAGAVLGFAVAWFVLGGHPIQSRNRTVRP